MATPGLFIAGDVCPVAYGRQFFWEGPHQIFVKQGLVLSGVDVTQKFLMLGVYFLDRTACRPIGILVERLVSKVGPNFK
jgi:hypothetical protein